ncbi:signal-transducing adaptor protein 2 isoform X2 [Ambystoma mexicanum]|uniref:signal-transducing adaptor protein 2 isoform X2 n=1 Tax=Ambystoma mexicanum TaxID=8296 RepID=UPI0037E77C80
MASSLPTPAVARSRPVHYYEGMMKKKGRGEALYKKFWAGLLGNALYFYNHHKDAQYVDVISLEDFVCLTDDNSRCKIPTEAKMTLQLKDRTVHLKVDSSEYREMWKGFILTVTELKVPSELALLPGPRHMMHEVLQKELERRTEVDKEYDEAKDEELLPCFHKVSRLEAQELLENHPDCGNLIIRPSQDSSGVSVTTCQKCNGVNVIRHYRVRHHRGMYVIEVDQAVTCKSLIDVMNYFVEKTNKALTPFIMMTDYEETLNFIPIKEENGESIIRHPGSLRGSSPPDPRGATRLGHGSLQPPPIPSGPPPEDEDEDDEQIYMNDDAVASARNPSLGSQEAWTKSRAQPVAPRNPTSQPVAPRNSTSQPVAPRKSTSLTDHTGFFSRPKCC